MGCGGTDIGVADGLSGALEADIVDGLMKTPADKPVVEGFLFAGGQQIGVGIGSPQDAAHGQIIADLGGHGPGYGNETVFFELGFFNIKGVVVVAEVMPLKPQRFVNAHTAACQK